MLLHVCVLVCVCVLVPVVTTLLSPSPGGGILSLYNISMDTSGYFICTSKNKIRSASCNITLKVLPRKNQCTQTLA